MAIYLDTNVLYPWRRFTELDRIAVSIVAIQIKQLIFVPQVVAEEAEAHHRRSLDRAVERLESARAEVSRLFEADVRIDAEDAPSVDEFVEIWRERLRLLARILPLHGDDAAEALHREVWGRPPARRKGDSRGNGGTGARDAAIWLTIARDHQSRAEVGHFISGDATAFGAGREVGPELAADLGGAAYPIRYYDGITQFLGLLGESTEPVDVSVEELGRRVPRVLRVVLEQALHVPRAVFETTYGLRFRTVIKESTPLRVLRARRYEGGDEAITVVDSEWTLLADCYVGREDAEDRSVGAVIEDVPVSGTIQLYLPGSDDAAVQPQIVSTRLSSDVTVFEHGDGFMTLRPA